MATFTDSVYAYLMYIYKLTNQLNGMTYIGQSRNPKARLKEHRNWKPGRRTRMARIISEVGRDHFVFEIIDSASTQERLDQKETYWISKLKTLHPQGYNMESGGKKGYRTHPESIELMRQKQIGNKYHCTPVIRSDGAVYSSVKEAEEALSVYPRSVTRVLNGTRKSIKGYTFKYLDREG